MDDPAKIAEGLAALAGPIDAAAPNPTNPNVGDVPAVARSLARFGQRRPVVANRTSGLIEAGHTLHAAAESLGWQTVAWLWVDDDPAAELGYALADNRTRDLAVYDPGGLAAWVTELHALDSDVLEDAGFDSEDLGDFMSDQGDGLEAGMMGSPAMTPKDRQLAYEGANIRSVLLPFQLTRYAWVLRHLATIRADLGVDNNADAIVRLIADRVKEEPPTDA